jgi:hypothetical protein
MLRLFGPFVDDEEKKFLLTLGGNVIKLVSFFADDEAK